MNDNIKPFRGLRYSSKAGEDIVSLLAPPYDVISTDLQNELLKKNSYNIVRLILGKKYDSDSDKNNRYTRASWLLKRWMSTRILQRDEKEAFYVYSQSYTTEGQTKTRVGFIARKKLEEYGSSVVPHEDTLSDPKTDRLNLIRACECNFSQIFGLYTDKEKTIDAILNEIIKNAPDTDATTDDGVQHRLWVVSGSDYIKKLTEAMEGKSILIADGHHRYESALQYYKEASEKGEAPEDVKYVMMYLTNSESEGFTILPTHRLVYNLQDLNPNKFLKKVSRYFEVEDIPSSDSHRNDEAEKVIQQKLSMAKAPSFGLYSGEGKYHFLKYTASVKGGPLEKLDVVILQNKILTGPLGIKSSELASETNVNYSQNINETAEKVDSGDFQLAFFLNATPVEHMWEVTKAGRKMPQKSTYFYPKLISGFVINPLY